MPEPVSPVVEGLENCEIVVGGPPEQPQYRPLPTLRTSDGVVVSRWQLSPEEREAIANGADIFLSICTFGGLYPPTRVDILCPADAGALIAELLRQDRAPDPPDPRPPAGKAEG